MKALLLAAGEGTRLRPLTERMPKPMLPLGGRPLLEHLVNLLRVHGVTEIAINLHYKPEAIVDHFGDGSAFGVRVTYSREETLLGSAGAAKSLEDFFDGTFLVIYGDVLTNVDLTQLAKLHRGREATATLAVYEVEDPTRCGVVDVDAAGQVQRFVEKPSPGEVDSSLANAGVYCLEPGVLDHVAPNTASDFGHDVFPRLIEAQQTVIAHQDPSAYFLDIGSPQRYEEAQDDLRSGRFVPSGVPRSDAVAC